MKPASTKVPALHLPPIEKLPELSNAELVKLRDAIKAHASELRKAGRTADAKAMKKIARRVRVLERASRGGKKPAAKKPAAKKPVVKEEHPLKKAA